MTNFDTDLVRRNMQGAQHISLYHTLLNALDVIDELRRKAGGQAIVERDLRLRIAELESGNEKLQGEYARERRTIDAMIMLDEARGW